MGAEIVVEHGYMIARLPEAGSACKGARITTDMVTVTGTENFLMAAALAEGETVLENAAQEPEISDLAEMLIAMGAQIEGHGTSRIRIQGVSNCTAARMPWWPTASRLAPSCARGATGVMRFAPCPRRPPDAVIEKLREGGRHQVEAAQGGIRGAPGAAQLRRRVSAPPNTRVSHRHAGPVHGAQLRGAGHGHGDRDHF